ncbi:hypothetical protein [Curtobacterium sp. MCPF17_052]
MNAHLGNDAATALPLASRQDGEYPRPPDDAVRVGGPRRHLVLPQHR